MAISFRLFTRRKYPATVLTFLLPFCLLVHSCTTSLYPLPEKESEAIFRPELVGSWEYVHDYGGYYLNSAQVQKAPGNQYRIQLVSRHFISQRDEPDTNYLLARLIPVDDYLFLDCVADKDHPSAADKDEYMRLGRSTIHYIFRIVLRNQNEVVELWELQPHDELRKILRQKKASFYAQSNNTLLLMEPSPQLKKLLVQLVREDPRGVWETTILIRADPGAGKPA